jgi:adenylosuccinate synthase
MIKYADIIVDLQAGDTGKGKVAHFLASKEDEYTHVVRYNGGGNAGHTVYHKGQKIVTHYIPIGFAYGLKSVIGVGCVVNVKDLFKEIQEIESKGLEVRKYLRIDKRTHVITDEHLFEELSENKIGTTKKGNGPAYRDKYSRKGTRAGDIPELQEFVIDTYKEFYGDKEVKILFEGAQGFELDIDWGDYPYVTSSHCTVGGAILNGVPPKYIRNTIGIAKVYATYVGSKNFEGDEEIFENIRELGNEYGATTGRPRQINWMDLDVVKMGMKINGVNHLIINKLDILEEIGIFKLNYKGSLKKFASSEDFCMYLISELEGEGIKIEFSKSPLTV